MRTDASPRTESLSRWIPRLIAGTAVVHLAYGTIAGADALADMVSDGVVHSLKGDDERAMALWFLLTGVAWLGLAGLARSAVDQTGRLPKSVGATLLATGVPLTVVDPASGGWLVAGIGVLALIASSREG